ncbi:uncharacterized protein LOC121857036 isoform X2 [Homarus americanus]|uniref:uncharacterized protein LOC121857036 isoform X2 n=1 Tax=Homarus americanus TaxID=6706 RepID=UPI001C449070|nr:uncharacterized protein LOC121857036 isoform X2 [Homarus americanus]
MAAKNKSVRKRGRECLEMNEREEDQESPIVIANIKRRKKTRDGVKSEIDSESGSTKLSGNSVTHTPVCKMTTSIVTLRRNSNRDSGWDHSISTSPMVNVPTSKREQNLASNVKKTYASGSKQIQDKNERSKRNSRSKSSLCDQPSKVDEIEENKIKEEDTGKGVDNDKTESSTFSPEAKVSLPEREEVVLKNYTFPDEGHNNDNCESHMVEKDGLWKNENECTVYVTSDISHESKTFIENIAKNSSKITVSEDFKAFETEMAPAGNYNLLATIASNIQMPQDHHSLPQTVRSVSSPRVPVSQVMPNLSANTSAITAIPTPIATFPMLPDMTRDVPGGTVFTVGIANSDSKKDHYSDLVSSVSSFACSSHNSLNFVSSNPTCSMITVDKNNLHMNRFTSSRDGEDHKNIQLERPVVQRSPSSIPIVQIDDDSESLLIERDYTQVPVSSSTLASSTPERATSTASPGATSNGRVHSASNFLRVDNWATYLLQRLELLYEREQECDLVLKFSTGETLKVHRAIVWACTSLLSEPHLVQREGEFVMPSDLKCASVGPVIRFLYSGRLDVQGTRNEVSGIYAAAQRLQVPPLTRLMDRRFPYLSPSNRVKTRLPIWKRSPEKSLRFSKQHPAKVSNKTASTGKRVVPPADAFHSVRQVSTTDGGDTSAGTSREVGEVTNIKDTAEGTGSSVRVEEDEEGEEDDEGQDGSVYLLVTNSQKIAKANAAVRRKRPVEEARPTRFELEEDPENASVTIATWSSKSPPLSPLFVATCVPSQDGSISSCTTSFTSTESLSPNPLDISNFTPRAPQCTARYKSSASSNVGLTGLATTQNSSHSQDPFSLLTQVVSVEQSTMSKSEEDINVRKVEDVSGSPNSKSLKAQDLIIEDDDTIGDDDIGKDSDELMEKISSICKQLEERDSEENECENKEVFVACDYKMEMVDCDTSLTENPLQISHVAEEDTPLDSKDPLVISNSSVPVKSILKKKKDKSDTNKLKKHVSFPLDENNELINEVATYSHAKEPAQSLIEVQKSVGSFKSNDNLYSPVKLTLSLKKKVLMNLSLSDSEVSESPSHEEEKVKDKKDGNSTSQSTSQETSRKAESGCEVLCQKVTGSSQLAVWNTTTCTSWYLHMASKYSMQIESLISMLIMIFHISSLLSIQYLHKALFTSPNHLYT